MIDSCRSVHIINICVYVYRKDMAVYKHKLEEANSRTVKTEKHLHDMKLKYR